MFRLPVWFQYHGTESTWFYFIPKMAYNTNMEDKGNKTSSEKMNMLGRIIILVIIVILLLLFLDRTRSLLSVSSLFCILQ